ncbi:hypothetical protein PM082_010619 [Marasmius tenuissimus]|nr:hypothetical protein PM082_010619 [Marasmius tenuissimus]
MYGPCGERGRKGESIGERRFPGRLGQARGVTRISARHCPVAHYRLVCPGRWALCTQIYSGELSCSSSARPITHG